MAAISSATLAKLSSRMASAVRSRKKRSTRFIQEARCRGEVEDDAIEAVMRSVSRVPPLQPRPDIRVLVGCVVVDDQMQGDIVGHFAIELLEEREPFGVRVFRRDEAGNFAVEIVQGSKESDGAVPDVVMC